MAEKKTALVTGASRGIGRAIAVMMAEAGYDLFLTALVNEGLLDELKNEIGARFDVRVWTSLCDAADVSDVLRLFEQIPRLDVLINNVGEAYYGLLSDMTADEWQHVIDANLSSVFYTCKAAIPAMVAHQGGRIINIASVWGESGASMEVAYSAAKAGVCGFTRALAKELAPSHIAVNAIAPGLIDTDMNSHLSADEWEGICAAIPAGRAATPAEVARMVRHVVEAPAYFTGQIVRFDGGMI